jgi:hypothetical protein
MSTRYEVHIIVPSPLTGERFVVKNHVCASLAEARVMLENVQISIEELAPNLPGIEAKAYEIEDTFIVTPLGLDALAAAVPIGRNARWWSEAIGQMEE